MSVGVDALPLRLARPYLAGVLAPPLAGELSAEVALDWQASGAGLPQLRVDAERVAVAKLVPRRSEVARDQRRPRRGQRRAGRSGGPFGPGRQAGSEGAARAHRASRRPLAECRRLAGAGRCRTGGVGCGGGNSGNVSDATGRSRSRGRRQTRRRVARWQRCQLLRGERAAGLEAGARRAEHRQRRRQPRRSSALAAGRARYRRSVAAVARLGPRRDRAGAVRARGGAGFAVGGIGAIGAIGVVRISRFGQAIAWRRRGRQHRGERRAQRLRRRRAFGGHCRGRRQGAAVAPVLPVLRRPAQHRVAQRARRLQGQCRLASRREQRRKGRRSRDAREHHQRRERQQRRRRAAFHASWRGIDRRLPHQRRGGCRCARLGGGWQRRLGGGAGSHRAPAAAGRSAARRAARRFAGPSVAGVEVAGRSRRRRCRGAWSGHADRTRRNLAHRFRSPALCSTRTVASTCRT